MRVPTFSCRVLSKFFAVASGKPLCAHSSLRFHWSAGKPRYAGLGGAAHTHARVVDVRSDTVTKPGPEMRRAMAQAEVGDDGLGEDPTVNANRYGLSVYMNGARVMNAAVAQRVHPSTILQHTDTVSLCLSKGLGSPVGAILAGPQDFISQAVQCRKVLGGVMRQAGILAAAGKLSLQTMIGRLEEDHHNAKIFAQALLDCSPNLFTVDLAAVETNIVRFHLPDPTLNPYEFCARMAQVGEGEVAALGQGIKVLMCPLYGNSVRAVWHLGISPEDTQLAIQKMRFVASEHLRKKNWA